jgi:hypothetical protein
MRFAIWCAIILCSALIGGGTVDTFWAWFIEPVFVTAPELRLGSAMGLALFVSIFTAGLNPDRQEDMEEGVARLIMLWVLIWTIGLIYHFVFGIGA